MRRNDSVRRLTLCARSTTKGTPALQKHFEQLLQNPSKLNSHDLDKLLRTSNDSSKWFQRAVAAGGTVVVLLGGIRARNNTPLPVQGVNASAGVYQRIRILVVG